LCVLWRGENIDEVSEVGGDHREDRVRIVRNGIDFEDRGFRRLQLSDWCVNGELRRTRFLRRISEKY
jgi:hypothetical protein